MADIFRIFRLLSGNWCKGAIIVLCAVTASASDYYFFTSDFEYRTWTYNLLDSRTVSLGSSQVSDAYNLNSMYSNPAAVSDLHYPQQIVSSAFYDPYQNISSVHIASHLISEGDHSVNIGASFGSSGLGHGNDNHAEALRFRQYDFDMNYAYALTHAVSVGTMLRFAIGESSQTGSYEWAGTSLVGIYYSPSSEVQYGVVYKGSFAYDFMGYDFRYISHDGLTRVQREKLPHRFEMGASFRYPSTLSKPFLVLSLSNEKTVGRYGVIYKGGVEVSPVTYLALRGGYLMDAKHHSSRFGIGLFIGRVQLDYTFVPLLSRPVRIHLLTITVP